MLRWYPSILLRVVLELTFVPIAFVSIFAVKALADRSTPWSIGSWNGPGASPDFWYLTVLLALGWTMLVLGWRGAKVFFRYLIAVWHLGLAAGTASFIIGSRDLVVQGEAMGFSLSLGILAPAYSMFALIGTLVWIRKDSRRGNPTRSVSPLQRRNKLAAFGAGIGVIVGWIAFSNAFQQIGVIACLAATIACHEAMRPVNPSEELHKALVGEGSAPE
jgi:hypothetical protein